MAFMRSVRVRFSLLALGCGAVLALVLLGRGGRDGAAGGPASAGQERGAPARGTLPPVSGRMQATSPREVAETEPGELPPEPEEEPPPPSPEGIVLRGTVRWADDGAPVPGLRLVCRGAGPTRFAVVSDRTGSFESEPVLEPGRLRLWPMGEPPREEGTIRHPKGLRLDRGIFLVPGDASTFEVELRIPRPPMRLAVEVRDRTDAPVEGAEVTLEIVARPDAELGGAGRVESPEHDIWTHTTDETGHAAFAVYALDSIGGLGLFAQHGDPDGSGPVLASDHRVLDLAGRVGGQVEERLILDEAAGLRVRVLDGNGAPVAGLWTHLEVGAEPLFAWLPEGASTNAEGEQHFGGLPPRSYVVAVSTASGWIRRRVELERGVERVLELVLGENGVPRLAVSGVVLDENGAPLPRARVTALYERPPGRGNSRVSRVTDGQGRFEFHAAPCAGVTVLLDGGLHGDEFTPASLTASFGERDLVFRRTRHVVRRTLDLELVDAVTGERLERALVITTRSPGTPEYEFVSAAGGLSTVLVGAHPDVRLWIDAPGYRRRSVAVLELLRSDEREGLHRVEVEPGLLRSIAVFHEAEDGTTVEGLAAAEVWDGARLLGKTDREGRFTLDLPYWPEGPLRVEAPGHRSASWLPADDIGDPGPWEIRLVRME